MIKCALFDLDGTLADTSADLGAATAYVIRQYGKEPEWTQADYKRFVGNGAKKLLDRAFEGSLSDDELDKALEIFKEKYNMVLNDNVVLYDGIKKQLDILKKKGIKLAVVTNKPHSSAVLMVRHLFGDGYFDAVVGSNEDKPKKPNPYTANETLKMLGCTPGEAIYFGDSDIDVFTAKNANIESVACSWGFRSYESLFSASPSVIIDKPEYISKLF